MLHDTYVGQRPSEERIRDATTGRFSTRLMNTVKYPNKVVEWVAS